MKFECSCSWEQTPGCIIEANWEGSIYYCPKCKQPLRIKEEPIAVKPPLGLKPRRINDEQRYKEVQTAIDRYCIDGLKIPIEWVEEYNELLEKIAL